MSSGLCRGGGADKPTFQVNIELNPLEPPGRLGKFSRGDSLAKLVYLTVDRESEVFQCRPCHGNVQICVRYVDGHSPFALSDG